MIRADRYLDAAPLLAWVDEQADQLARDPANLKHNEAGGTAGDRANGHAILAGRMGVDESWLRKGGWRTSGQVVRDTVDQALDRAGHRLEDLWPDEDDVNLEPDAYCTSCRDVVTPIDGACPWCDRRVTGDVPSRLYCGRCDLMRFPALDGDCWRCGGTLTVDRPWLPCACGCGRHVARFADDGREVRYVRGHAPRTLERSPDVDASAFREWLHRELRELDPIQSLARRAGLPRERVLDVLAGRVQEVPLREVRDTLWRSSREGQGKGLPARPGSARLADLYPEHVKSKVCPGCGGGKAPHAEVCRRCRRRAPRPGGSRESSVTDEVLLEARRLRREERLSFAQLGERLSPRTRCQPASLENELRLRFRDRGWETAALRTRRPDPEIVRADEQLADLWARGLTIAEIATVVGVTPSQAGNRVTRARARGHVDIPHRIASRRAAA